MPLPKIHHNLGRWGIIVTYRCIILWSEGSRVQTIHISSNASALAPTGAPIFEREKYGLRSVWTDNLWWKTGSVNEFLIYIHFIMLILDLRTPWVTAVLLRRVPDMHCKFEFRRKLFGHTPHTKINSNLQDVIDQSAASQVTCSNYAKCQQLYNNCRHFAYAPLP